MDHSRFSLGPMGDSLLSIPAENLERERLARLSERSKKPRVTPSSGTKKDTVDAWISELLRNDP